MDPRKEIIMKNLKKIVIVLAITILAAGNLYSQSDDVLTNSTILKMVKARLSDELIIDEIKNSPTSFNVSTDSIKILTGNNVSDDVIKAMKAVSVSKPEAVNTDNVRSVEKITEGISGNTEPVKANNVISIEKPAEKPEKIAEVPKKESPEPPVAPPSKPAVETMPEASAGETFLSEGAVGYVLPVTELIKFYDNELKTLQGTIKAWDGKIRLSISEGNKIREKITGLGKEITSKKNEDSRGFTDEIIVLIEKLNEYRESYSQFENSMVADGLKLAKEIEGYSSKLDKSLSNIYGEVSQDVKKTSPDPSLVGIPDKLTVVKEKIDDNVVSYIAPLEEMLFFFQNEKSAIHLIIESWNQKVAEISRKDKEVLNAIEPLKKEMTSLQEDQKKNKKKIAELKDQIADREKERKQLAQKMGDESEELAKYLTERCKTVQNSVSERITDIIKNIKYSYQDSFTYKSI